MSTTPSNQPETQYPAVPQEDQPRKLSLFLKISIVLLAAVSLAAIVLLFVGEFDGKFIRIFSTFVVFAVFVLLTALDTRLDLRSNWYAPVALIANSYILALVLIVTWMTEYEPFFLGWDIFWKAVVVIIVTRVVILCCQLLLGMGEQRSASIGVFAFVTSILAVISGILFTAPAAIETFDISIPELYWRIAVATLLLTALGLSITLLLNWSYGAADREAARNAREAEMAQQGVHSYTGALPAGYGQAYGQPYVQQASPMQQAPMPQAPMMQPPYAQQPAQPMQQTPTPMQQAQAQPAPMQQPHAQQPAQPGELLPWPTFADGTPLPAGPDGQPDFSVLDR